MQKMIILSGLPASGKSTYAADLTAGDTSYVRINYDELRWFDNDGNPVEYKFSREAEKEIKKEADVLARESAAAGYNLVIDNTNLTERAKAHWANLGVELRMQVDLRRFYDVPLDECIRRDSLRKGWRHVGRAVIERMALFNNLVDWPKDQKIVIVDLDGTVADCSHRQHYLSTVCGGCWGTGSIQGLECPPCQGTGKRKKNHDAFFAECSKDTLIKPVAQWVRSLAGQYFVCIVSGRPIDRGGKETVKWLADNDVPYKRIFMRNAGDRRPDTIVKAEILANFPYDECDASYPDIAFAIDDRPCVIRMWQEHGIKVYDVGNGVEF